jgi:alpha-galactosidase
MIDDPNFELSLKSLIGTLPIVLGDPRALNPEQKARVKKWIEWMKYMEETHSIMSFRQDLAGFGEPAEGNWDGFQRMNTETRSGGLVGVFKTNSHEIQRKIFVQYLDPNSNYSIYKAPYRELIGTMTGIELIEKGFNVNLEKYNDGEIFEISKVN